MKSIVDIHKKEDQAKYVAGNTELLTVSRHSDAGDLTGLTVSSYHNLVSFLAERDNEWRRTLDRAEIPTHFNCRCDTRSREKLYDKTKKNLERRYLQGGGGVYLKALEDLSQSSQSACSPNCPLVHGEIKAFIERMVKREGEGVRQIYVRSWYVK